VARLQAVLTGAPPDGAFQAVLDAMKAFTHDLQSDDVSLHEVQV
jgi:hypothetical protein